MMTRHFGRHKLLLGFLVLGLLLTTSTFIARAIPIAQGAPKLPVQPIATLPPRDYCYNFDLYNLTGQNANDFHITLRGPTRVSWLYTGSLQPFPQVTHGLFSDGSYQFHFQGVTVRPGQKIHLGWCMNSPMMAFTPSSTTLDELHCLLRWGIPVPPGWGTYYLPAFWTRDGVPISGQVLPAIGHTWQNWGGMVGIAFQNINPNDLQVARADFAIIDHPVPLNDLNWDMDAYPIAWQAIEGAEGAIIPGVGEAVGEENILELSIPGNFTPDDPNYVIMRVWTVDPENPENMIQSAAQASIQEIMTQDK